MVARSAGLSQTEQKFSKNFRNAPSEYVNTEILDLYLKFETTPN